MKKPVEIGHDLLANRNILRSGRSGPYVATLTQVLTSACKMPERNRALTRINCRAWKPERETVLLPVASRRGQEIPRVPR